MARYKPSQVPAITASEGPGRPSVVATQRDSAIMAARLGWVSSAPAIVDMCYACFGVLGARYMSRGAVPNKEPLEEDDNLMMMRPLDEGPAASPRTMGLPGVRF